MLSNAFCHEACRSHLSFFKTLILLSAILYSPAFASAQTEEEMKMLRMYFIEDELVLAPTRSLKPLSQVAENMSIVTDDDIQAMNAHTIEEVLEMVTGVFVYYQRNDFYKSSYLLMQGTPLGNDERHVLVLLDNVPWNFLTSGQPSAATVPVGIIKRIEIIKGPASSVWGSSLGGVINIVTKDAGDTVIPTGSINGSFGERSSRDYNGSVAGKAGTVGYYLYAGRQDSDGFRRNRYYERNSFYGKLDILFSPDVKLLLTSGYSEPHFNQGDYIEDPPETTPTVERVFYTTAALTAGLTDELSLEASYYELSHKFTYETNDLFTGELHYGIIEDEKTLGATAKLLWTHNIHNAVLGWDISHGKYDQTVDYGPFYGGPLQFVEQPGISKWAVFVNDTVSIGKFSITPSVRYDENNISGGFTSPAIGATYKLGARTVLRAAIAKGFTTVPLSYTSEGSSVKPEKVLSYQAGAESRVTDYLNAKGSLFVHDMEDFIIFDYDKLMYHNKGSSRRAGMELELETIPFYNTSLMAGFSYMRNKLIPEDLLKDLYPDNDIAAKIYDYNIAVRYNDRKSFKAQLTGNYTWWDQEASDEATYKAFIWNLNLDKKVYSADRIAASIFFTAHNIFNGSYYESIWHQNPRRWLEGGVRLEF